MNSPSSLIYLRDIILLPFSVTVIIRYCIPGPGCYFRCEFSLGNLLGILLLGISLLFFLSTIYRFKTTAKGTLAPWQPIRVPAIIAVIR